MSTAEISLGQGGCSRRELPVESEILHLETIRRKTYRFTWLVGRVCRLSVSVLEYGGIIRCSLLATNIYSKLCFRLHLAQFGACRLARHLRLREFLLFAIISETRMNISFIRICPGGG